MLKRVVWMPPTGVTGPEFTVSVLEPDANGLFIDHIDGLGPVEDTINTKPFAGPVGEYFVGRHRGKRNLVFHFGLDSDGHDVAAARDSLLRACHTLNNVRFPMRFEFDNRDAVQIAGFLETSESDPFSSDPESQLSIICPRPNFIAAAQSTVTGMTDNEPDLTEIITNGDRDIGFAVKIIPEAGLEDHFAEDLKYESKIAVSPGVFTEVNLLHVNGNTSAFGSPMVSGEEYWMDSRLGGKSVYIYNPDTGEVRNALYKMTSDSDWPKLFPNVTNKFSISIPHWAQLAHPQFWAAYWHDEFGSI